MLCESTKNEAFPPPTLQYKQATQSFHAGFSNINIALWVQFPIITTRSYLDAKNNLALLGHSPKDSFQTKALQDIKENSFFSILFLVLD